MLARANTAPTGGAADTGYSNNGTGTAPGLQDFQFNLPLALSGTPGVQVRVRFDTGDSTYQGFRGLGVDTFSSETAAGVADGELRQRGPPAGWTFDGPSGPGGPFWQVLQNPQNVSIKSPEINPNLVTLAGGDSGALPPADTGTGIAWFGNPDSGTFCGPDFASTDVAPDTAITSGPANPTASGDASFEFTATEPAFFECQLDGGGFNFCASPQAYSELANGTHTFEVRATDFTGNVDPTPASYTWTIRPATLADLPDPEVGVDVNVQELAGVVKVGIPSAAARAAGVGHVSQKGDHVRPAQRGEADPGRLLPRHPQGHGRPAERREPLGQARRPASSRAGCSRCASRARRARAGSPTW